MSFATKTGTMWSMWHIVKFAVVQNRQALVNFLHAALQRSSTCWYRYLMLPEITKPRVSGERAASFASLAPV